jgi:glycosyltransferase involved in cell wall biosynthesis
MPATETATQQPPASQPILPQVSVIVPARNEEASLGACLESLVTQTGVVFEIIVVDDHSTDRTRDIAESFTGRQGAVRVIEAGPLPAGWTGKNNAVTAGARSARGPWLLFTDADTIHLQGSLARSLAEANDNGAEMLSYSPEQIAISFWEKAILPVVFAELAGQYPPSKVSDPSSTIAAANGQYILIKREAYDAIGGHAAIAGEILEDVALARAVKASGRKIRFRYAADAVRTRMYRSFSQLREGWTKNLALLFPHPGWLAAKTLLLWGAFQIALLGFGSRYKLGGISGSRFIWLASAFLIGAFLVIRLRVSNFDDWTIRRGALFGMPMFAYLLMRSKRAHASGSVQWKGRSYSDRGTPSQPQPTRCSGIKPTSTGIELRHN